MKVSITKLLFIIEKGNILPKRFDIALFLRKNGRLVFVRGEGERRVGFHNPALPLN